MSASEMLLQQQLAAQKVMQAKLEAEAKAKAQEAKARAQAKGQTQSKQTLGKQQSPFITVSAPGAAGPGIASQIMEYDMMSNGKSTNGNHHHDSILQGLQPSIIIQLPSLDAPHQQVIPSLAPEGSMSSDGSLPLTEETPVGTPRGASIEPFGGGGASASGKGSRPNVQSQAPGGRPQIFKATYSGVPVFEMICRGVAVMRRRSDSYLNATQILKVADFDKPQRTRILEREVQKGEHEKVQGGYGKYQGTWVPYERGVQLCQEYNVLQLLKPLLEYQVSKVNSPPLAPKHVTAASNRPRKPREPKVPGEQKPKKSKLKGAAQIIPGSGTQGPVMGVIDGSGTSGDGSVRVFGDGDEDMSTSEMDHDEDGPQTRAGSEESMDGTMSILSARSRTPSPIESRPELSSSEMSDDNGASPGQRRQRSVGRSPSSRKRQHVSRPGDELFIGYNGGSRGGGHDLEMRDTPGSPSIRQASPNRRRRAHATERSRQMETESTSAGDSNQGHYAETLLNYFVSDSTSLPSILVQPPADLDFDLIIDEEGHTPLHWAVAMARTKIVRLLVQHGADIYRVNNQGQTALMRSVLFTNNFDMKTFPTLLEILQKTIFTIDKNDQTVFHHVAVTAGMRGKVHASRYYMECLLDKLGPHPQELASIINVQDIVGDTALIIAARAGNKKVVKLLLDAKADPKIRNRSGRNADDIMREADLSISGASSSAASSLHPPSQQHPPPSSQSLSSTPAQRAQNYPPQQHSLPPQQQQQQQQQQRYPAHQPPPPHHPIGGNGGPNHPRAVGHTSSQQTHFSPSSMPPSASATSTPRVHQTSPHNPHGHPTFAMRVTTPPPPPSTSRQAGHPLSSPNMDRPLNPGYQEYPSRNSFPSHAPPPSSLSSSSAPLYSQHLESGSGRGPVGYGNHPSGDGDERGMAMERSTSSRGVGQLGKGHGRPLQRTISQVTELFEQLTEAYEKDLYEKEQDLLNARNMLQETQTEIQDGQRTIEDLKSKTTYLGEAEAQIKTLENGIREEITLRQRLKLENLVAQEEARLRLEKDGGTLPDSFATTSGQDAASHVQALEQEATELRSKLAQLQQSRKDQVEQIVQLKSQQGKRRHEYRRLIALCCNISVDEVDGLLAPLLNTLGSEDGVI
ncbi:hypothetical protein BGX31_009751 [Mortierella sp. GBA43]|nr:hypothetical protein BGX31_009751 [Mortierella sp. GBA43]